MSGKSTIAIGYKVEETEGGFKKLIMNAEDFQKAMSKAVVTSERLQGSIINFGNLSQGIDSLNSTFESMLGGLRDLTAAYDAQMEAERQLEQVMKNSMGAREEDIQSIKDFCSAQQQIGIVGDEVQLAGAQELATYLELKGSLKSLIPVMNDMVAQQYGYNHSAENATQIATMLGKVMNGQTGALSRYGYSFDEAQEKILKYGTEAERCAVLVDVVSASVGGMNEKLAKTDTGRMKQFENAAGDLKEQLGGLVKFAEPVLTIGANSTMAAMGVVKLVKGVKSLALSMKALSLAGGAVTIVLTALAAAYLYFTTRTDNATTALDRLTDAKERARREAEMLAEAEEAETDARKSAMSSIQLNIAKLKEFKGSKTEEKKLVKEMNDTYGQTMGYFKSVSDWYDTLIANSKAYCQQLVNEAKSRKYADQIAQLEIDRENIVRNSDGSKRKYSTTRETARRHLTPEEMKRDSPERQKLIDKGLRIEGRHIYGKWHEWVRDDVVGTSDIEKAQSAYAQLGKDIENLRKKQEQSLNTVAMPVMGSAIEPASGTGSTSVNNPAHEKSKTRLQEINSLLQENEDKWLSASKEERAAIKAANDALLKEKDTIELTLAELSRPDALNSLKDYNAELEYQQKLLSVAPTDKTADILETIDALEKERASRSAKRGTQTAEDAKIVATDPAQAKTLSEIDAAVSQLNQKIMDASTDEIEALERSKMAFEEKRAVMERGILIPRMQKEVDDMLGLSDKELTLRIRDIGFDALADKIKEIKELLGDLDNPPTEGQKKALEGMLANYQTWQKECVDTKDVMVQTLKQAQSAFSGMGEAFEMPVLDVAGIIAGAIATMIQGYASASSQSSGMGPFGWAAFSLVGLAQLAAMVSQIKGMGAFADGGIVSGPTLGLVGEYAGAKHNPEVIAPLDRLQAIIGDKGGDMDGRVEFEIRADRLYGVLRKYERNKNRT